MTVEEIIAKSRRLLQDTVNPYRWSDNEIRDDLRDAIRHLHSLVPSTRYVDGLLADEVELPDDEEGELRIDNRYREALVYYVVYLCYSNDATDTVNAQMAESYRAKAEALMV